MPLSLISNFAANVAQRNLGAANTQATSSLAKLSAGSRVATSRDDAASLAVGSRLNAEVVGLKQASINAGQAISMLQIADGAMGKVNEILVRMKSLAVQAGSGGLSGTERSMLDTEYQSMLSEINRIAADTDFAGRQLVTGKISVATYAAGNFQVDDGVTDISMQGDFGAYTNGIISYDENSGAFSVTIGPDLFSGALAADTHNGTWMTNSAVVTLTSSSSNNKIDIQIGTDYWMGFAHASGFLNFFQSDIIDFTFKVGSGADSTADDISVTVNSVDASDLGIDSSSITTTTNADAASVALSNAIDNVTNFRSDVASNQNRLEFAAANIATAAENTESARSQLLDLNVAMEMSNFISKQILVQTGVSMLAQANQMPNNLLRLFQ